MSIIANRRRWVILLLFPENLINVLALLFFELKHFTFVLHHYSLVYICTPLTTGRKCLETL